MPAENDDIDGAAREVLSDYELPLARAGLRADYRGVLIREELPGARESDAEVWLFRGGDLVDCIDVPIQRPGLSDSTPDETRRMLREALYDVLSLHERSDSSELAVSRVENRGYIDRLMVLVRRVMPMTAAVAAAGYFVISLLNGNGLASVLLGILAFIGTYIAALPTAALASLIHTALLRLARGETMGRSISLGVLIGAVFGAMTPWLIPIIEPWPLLPIGLAALSGGVVGGLYGALATRYAPLPPPAEPPILPPPSPITAEPAELSPELDQSGRDS
jgi:hypothetical protein